MRKWWVLLLTVIFLSVSGSVFAVGPQDTWKITSPANGATVTGPDVTVTVDPGDMKIVAPGPVVAGEGHWHYSVDGQDVGKGPMNTFTYKGLTPGKHTLRVELQQGDHSPYPGDTGREVTVNVALPNTGTNTAAMVGAGLVLLLAGGYLFWRRGAVQAQ